MEAHLATVSVPGCLAWQPLMDAIGDQLLAGFGNFENLGQLEEALFIALERDGSTEIVHTGEFGVTDEQLASYLGVLASVAQAEPLKVSFVGGALRALLVRSEERDQTEYPHAMSASGRERTGRPMGPRPKTL